MTKHDVVIIGAGPYGLSVTAHLRTIKGLDVCTFGEPMRFWQRNMPIGMFLRSGWAASHIASPNQSLTLGAFQTASGSPISRPVPLDRFLQYGLWYQRQAAPHLDQRKVLRVERHQNGFRIDLADGETVISRRVVVAAGISKFARCPQEFAGIPSYLASHTSEHRDLRGFGGEKVLVIGSGQSALESAALLHECGAEVEVVARSRQIRWLGGSVSNTLHQGLGFLSSMLYAPTDVGPAGISQLVARPNLVRPLPRSIKDWLRKRSIRPAGAEWLIARLQNVPFTLGRSIVSVVQVGEQVKVSFNDGSKRTVDHVLLGTGYRMDVSKYEFLAPELIRAISCFEGYPKLQAGFESSVPGLHFIGAPALWSFGPLMQFVVGTHFVSRSLHRHIFRKTTREHVQVAESKLSSDDSVFAMKHNN
ncbi:MAG TPA: NAD(P)-binding domain-containing protein [Candidatus Saccharimonadales bacterium]|jgi:cation diffusion facilitator CzcD-associated flavoprotein CzcO|nr:NAD(P)-binding domain-containing protein [Candidatus Saccharimonadales bacterium]